MSVIAFSAVPVIGWEHHLHVCVTQKIEVSIFKSGRKHLSHLQGSRMQFYDGWPVAVEGGKLSVIDRFESIPALLNLLPTLENEVLAADIQWKEHSFSAVFASAKLSRARWYFIVRPDALLLSDDLRELLPYSTRRLNTPLAYGILKYGESPEYHTAVTDIFTIPAATYLHLDEQTLLTYLQQGAVPPAAFPAYFKMPYTFTGGSVADTEQVLTHIIGQVATQRPDIFISGGIDSTLLNALYTRATTAAYPAHFIHFGKADQELAFARWAVKDTRAELQVYEMGQRHFVPAMEAAAGMLAEPVIDCPGSVFVGAFLRQQLGGYQPAAILDGTAADSLYGSRDYNKPILQGVSKPRFQLQAGEYLSGLLRLYHLNGHERFFPRDSFEQDQNLLELQWYLGPFANTFFRNARQYTEQVSGYYKKYYDLIDASRAEDSYARYTILKLALYAAKQTTRKVYDMHPGTQVVLPFLYRSMLKDQGRYSWKEKSIGSVVKYPLKKILEQYIDPGFIYRKKVGLNNQHLQWFDHSEVRLYLSEIFKNGKARQLLHPWAASLVDKAIARKEVHPNIKHLVLSMTSMDLWMRHNKVEL